MQPSDPPSPLLQSVPNFRDMGGCPSRNGRMVRTGLLFRSGILDELDDADLERLNAIGVRTVCDLRSHGERERYTTAWHEHDATPAVLSFDLNVDIRGREPEILRLLRTDPSPDSAVAGMVANYTGMPAAMAPHLATLFDRLLDPDGVPLLLHCHAGKDRTGFVCAIVLLALDVPRDAVLRDYMLTGERFDLDVMSSQLTTIFAQYVPGAPLTSEIMRPIADVRPAYLQASLDAVDAQFGSLDRYLAEQGRLDPGRRRRLHELFLESYGAGSTHLDRPTLPLRTEETHRNDEPYRIVLDVHGCRGQRRGTPRRIDGLPVEDVVAAALDDLGRQQHAGPGHREADPNHVTAPWRHPRIQDHRLDLQDQPPFPLPHTRQAGGWSMSGACPMPHRGPGPRSGFDRRSRPGGARHDRSRPAYRDRRPDRWKQ